jgi:ring-1,2-phenylacetyl-CoA epoxidase subunit PaaD
MVSAEQAVAAVPDPEIPVLTIADLGMLREVRVNADNSADVTVIPTYTGCPAMETIAADIQAALAALGIAPARVHIALSPAWSTEMISPAGRAKLAEYGIAPPPPAHAPATPPACPRCGAGEAELLSPFGSTACKSLWRCRACREPFDLFKCH